MQCIYFFLVKDGDATRNINTQKCLNLQSRYAATRHHIPQLFCLILLNEQMIKVKWWD